MAEDDESPPPSPRLQFDGIDTHVYGHLPSLVDASDRKEITRKTKLIALHQEKSILLKNLTEVASPSIACHLEDADGTFYGLPCTRSTDKYLVKVTYNKLGLAPALRVGCYLLKSPTVYYHRFGVEFHFNAFSGPDTELQDYEHSPNDIISFSANGASCFGFGVAKQHLAGFGQPERDILSYMESLATPEERRPIKIHLRGSAMQMAGLANIRARLPGGSGALLTSIGSVEYSCFGDDPYQLNTSGGKIRGPKDLMRNSPYHLFTPCQSADTFRSMKEAAVELASSADALHKEEKEALRLWSNVQHIGKLLPHGNFVVLPLKFRPFRKLGSKEHDVQYRLPNNLFSTFTFKIPGKTNAVPEKFSGFLLSNTAGLPSGYDAYFLIVSKPPQYFQPGRAPRPNAARIPPELIKPPREDDFYVFASPHSPNFTFKSQLTTVSELQKKRNKRWLGVLLNQTHDIFKSCDLTEDHNVSEEAKAAADRWLETWMSWNAEQLSAIRGIRRAKNGLVVIMGPAGTGKTLLQQALAIYFYKLGFHILALSPANSNADALASAMWNLIADYPDLAGVAFLRLYPGSRDHAVEAMTGMQASNRQVGHESGNALPLSELKVAIDELAREQSLARPYGVVDIIREFIEKYKNGTLDDGLGNYTADQYRMAYIQTKGHIVGLNRFMITTTGNVLATEMLEHWFSAKSEYGIPRVRVMVFVDEAAKDLEINVWSGIVCEKWAPWVQGVFLFGDDKQLQPTNTSAKGKVVFNTFSDRLDIALPVRLVREGFPCYRLLEQRRMHSSIAAFPNDVIYSGTLRNGPGMDDTLEQRKPGFSSVLSGILLQSTSLTSFERQEYQDASADAKLRLHWIEVNGKRDRNIIGSLFVTNHVKMFFKNIYPMLRTFFDQRDEPMGASIMIICAYRAQLHLYQDEIVAILARNPNLKKVDMPRVLTVDASQGQESFMVIFDGSFQHGDVLGFVVDKGRINVAITRAKEAFWIIGGSMQLRFPRDVQPPNLMLQYKNRLNAEHSHKFS